MTAIIVPAYFSAKPSDDLVRHLLWLTLGDAHHYTPLEHVWVVVDGDPRTEGILRGLQSEMARAQGATFHILPLAENHGKLWAIQEGARAILSAQPDIQYLVIRDGDGDHAASAVPQLLRSAAFLAESRGHLRMIVIGARPSRHRPMGWIRGELEALLDRITLDALSYALARQGRALDLSNCSGEAAPDLSSGFKVYGREVAAELFVNSQPQMATLSPSDYWHYGPETVTIIEAGLTDVLIAETSRLTWDGQPATSFGEFRHVALYGELLAWVLARLEIPLSVAARFYDNLTPHLPLRTTAQGAEMLEALRDHALTKLSTWKGGEPILPAPPRVPFV
jgi:hypothetical protein